MTLTDVLTIFAILLSPVIAVQVTQWLDRAKESRKRKIDIFSTLMATRAAGLTPAHVEALNRIAVEFYAKGRDEKKYNKVLEAWRLYHDNLFSLKDESSEGIKAWTARNEDLLIDLLYEMGISLGYYFEKVQIKRGHYYPRMYGDINAETTIIRRGLTKIFLGEKAFPIIAAVLPPPQQPPVAQVQIEPTKK
jgi:hypothetical protein